MGKDHVRETGPEAVLTSADEGGTRRTDFAESNYIYVWLIRDKL